MCAIPSEKEPPNKKTVSSISLFLIFPYGKESDGARKNTRNLRWIFLGKCIII